MRSPEDLADRLAMALRPDTLDRCLRQRLRPAADCSEVPPWNLAELADLLPKDRPLRPAAVLVGLMPHDDGLRVLLTRRNDDLPNHAGQISFPGGRREPGDRDWVDVARREAEEEVGLGAGQMEPLGLLAPYATISAYCVTPVVAWLDPALQPKAQDSEVAEIFDAPLSWLLDPQRRHWEKIRYGGRERGYWVIPYGRHRIWGATAAMLVDLARILEAE
jgi:8-oxo-dGTP pyrophosphatase MutT (NUDIX family)